MALKKRFREAARNEFRFLFLILLCLDDFYFCSNIIVSLFFSFVPREVKVVTCCPENRFCPRDQKNSRKFPVHIFELKFLHSMIYTITKLPYVLNFLI